VTEAGPMTASASSELNKPLHSGHPLHCPLPPLQLSPAVPGRRAGISLVSRFAEFSPAGGGLAIIKNLLVLQRRLSNPS
jgi:hypothetical protein